MPDDAKITIPASRLVAGASAVIVIKFGFQYSIILTLVMYGGYLVFYMQGRLAALAPGSIAVGSFIVAFLIINIMQICVWGAKGFLALSFRRLMLFTFICVAYQYYSPQNTNRWMDDNLVFITILLTVCFAIVITKRFARDR